MGRIKALPGVVVTVLAFNGTSWAAQAAETASATTLELEEVIVTATRRETNLMETAGAISVLSGDELQSRGIVSIATLDSMVPNMKVLDQQNQGMGAVQISMRGIVNSSFIEIGDPNVGFHVDGVYMSRPQAALNLLFDAQRLEIARGPQGTLYGRNSTVGSINVVNNRPSADEFAASGTAEVGSYDNKVASGVVNVPVIDGVLALRASGFWQERNTYYNLLDDDVLVLPQGLTLADSPYRERFGNGTGDDGAGAIDQNAWRVSALLTPFDDFSVYASYEKFNNNSPIAPSTVRGHEYTAYLSNPHVTDQTIETFRGEIKYEIADAVELKGTVGDQTYHHEIMVDLDAGTSRYSPERTNPLASDALTFEQTFYDRDWTTDSRSYELVASSTYQSDVQWLAGYFNFKEDTFRDFWIDLPTNGSGIINFNQPSREAESEAFFGRIDWDLSDKWHVSAGLRRTNDKRTDTGVNRFSSFPGDGSVNAYGSPVFIDRAGVTDLQFLCSGNLPVGPCAGYTPLPPGTVTDINGGWLRIPGLNDGFAAATGSPIGQIDAGIAALTAPGATVFTNAITTDAQLREISRLLSANQEIALIGAAGSFPRVFYTEQEFSYTDASVTLDWSPRDGSLLYGTVSTGHKAGSQEIFFHPRLHQFINSVIEPEKLVSYELGWKEEFKDIGKGLNVSTALFFMDYKDKQQSVFVDGGDLFCASTFGDFNGDGFLENFVQFLGGVPIFAESAALVNSGNATLRPDVIGVDGQPSWELSAAQIQQAISDCSQGSRGVEEPLADRPGMPNFLELMQVNFGNATIAGIELEYAWNVTSVDRLSGFATYNLINEVKDPRADALPFNLHDSLACSDRVGGCPNIASTDGNELPFAPDFTFRAVYEHDFRIGQATLTAGVDFSYNSSYWLSIWNTGCYQSVRLGTKVCNNSDKQEGYEMVDLRLRFTSPSGKFFVEGFSTNVTGTTYATGNIRPTNEDSVTPFAFNAPRMYGLRTGFNFF